MLIHRRRLATMISLATPVGPKGCGGGGPSLCSLLLGDEKASPSSHLRRSGPPALATLVPVSLFQATRTERNSEVTVELRRRYQNAYPRLKLSGTVTPGFRGKRLPLE